MDLVCIEAVRKSVLGLHLSEERETSLQPENFILFIYLQIWMVKMQYLQMVVLGTYNHATFCI